MKAIKIPRQYSLVRLTKEYKKWLVKNHPEGEMLKSDSFIYLGEIPNMKGHCVLIDFDNSVIRAVYHIEDFEEIPDDET